MSARAYREDSRAGQIIPRWPHRGRLSYRAAVAIQRRLAGRVIAENSAGRIRYVAGLDAAFSEDGQKCLAAAVLWDLRAVAVCEQRLAIRRVQMPYIPGLLSFREAPAMLAALRGLSRLPDVLLCDGQGIAHPRRFGVASHVGVLSDLPSVGCAKSRLMGAHGEPGLLRGDWTPLKEGGEVIGSVLRTREGARPLYVSVGHRITLARARALVMRCSSRFRLPEPTRLADKLVALAKVAVADGGGVERQRGGCAEINFFSRWWRRTPGSTGSRGCWRILGI